MDLETHVLSAVRRSIGNELIQITDDRFGAERATQRPVGIGREVERLHPLAPGIVDRQLGDSESFADMLFPFRTEEEEVEVEPQMEIEEEAESQQEV